MGWLWLHWGEAEGSNPGASDILPFGEHEVVGGVHDSVQGLLGGKIQYLANYADISVAGHAQRLCLSSVDGFCVCDVVWNWLVFHG